MKNKQEIISVREDQTYLEGINLITGLKINYDRVAITPALLNAMCINQKLTKPQKALKILKKGQNMQRWSILQNLALYLQDSQSYQEVFQTIWKYFQDLANMLGVLAQGIQHCLSNMINQFQKTKIFNQKHKLSKKAQQTIFKIVYRGLTDQKYNVGSLQDLSNLFSTFFNYLEIYDPNSTNQFIQQCKLYINSSFAMNALPQKRKISFQMLKHLIEHSKKMYNEAKSKALFFNNDQNPLTRRAICQLMTKILKNNQCQQIRKCILEYFLDQNPIVRQVAFQCLITIPHQKHVQAILKCLKQQNEQIQYQFIGNIQKISENLSTIIKKSQKYQELLINYCNKILTQKRNDDLKAQIIQNLQYFMQLCFTQKKSYQDVICLQNVDFEKQELYKALIKLYSQTETKQLKIFLNSYVQKFLKANKSIFFNDLYFLQFYLNYLKNGSQQSNYVHVNYLTKSIDENKWRQTEIILKNLIKAELNQINYQKITLSLSRLILNCPYNLLNLTCRLIARLMVTKRKNMDLFTSLKQKLINSKCWMHRRNYIILYSQIKQETSFQYQRLIPILNYKLISKDQVDGIRFELLKHIIKIYTHIDPTSYVQKNAIKDTLIIFQEDSNEQISQKAFEISDKIKQIDSDIESTQINLKRNIKLVEQQQKMKQKQTLLKKSIKTEKDLGAVLKKQIKIKSKVAQNRTSLNIGMDLLRPGTGVYKRSNFINESANLANLGLIKQENKLNRSGSGVVKIQAKKVPLLKKETSKK